MQTHFAGPCEAITTSGQYSLVLTAMPLCRRHITDFAMKPDVIYPSFGIILENRFTQLQRFVVQDVYNVIDMADRVTFGMENQDD